MDSNTLTTRFICLILAVAAAVLSVFSIFGAITVGTLKSKDYVAGKFQQYDAQLMEVINSRLLEECKDMPVPAEGFASALTKKETDVILYEAAKDIVLSYELDFSDSQNIYNYFLKGLTDYCEENDISILSEDLNRCACLAVDITNEVLTSGSTNNIKIFQLTIGKTMAIRSVICAVIAVVCLILIDLINRGRHRKYSYIGMAFVNAGMIMIFATLFVKKMQYIENFRFNSFEIYNNAIRDAVSSTLLPYPIIGAVFAVIGIVILIANYRYFKLKNERIQANKEMNIKLKDEYIRHYNKKKNELTFSEAEETDRF